jgi:hypothetical protein
MNPLSDSQESNSSELNLSIESRFLCKLSLLSNLAIGSFNNQLS